MVIYGYRAIGVLRASTISVFCNQMENHMLITWKIEIEPRKEINA